MRRVTPLCLLLLIIGVAPDIRADEECPSDTKPDAPRKSLLETVWTYRLNDGVEPPDPPIVFTIIRVPAEPGARSLVVGDASLIAPAKLLRLSRGEIVRPGPGIFYVGPAPAREIAFSRLDLDADKRDEVILTGRGGAGATSLLSVFRIDKEDKEQVREIFSDSSRFGFWIFDEQGKEIFQIANPGFEWVPDKADLNLMVPKEYHLHQLRQHRFQRQGTLTSRDFTARIAKLESRGHLPLNGNADSATIRVYASVPPVRK